MLSTLRPLCNPATPRSTRLDWTRALSGACTRKSTGNASLSRPLLSASRPNTHLFVHVHENPPSPRHEAIVIGHPWLGKKDVQLADPLLERRPAASALNAGSYRLAAALFVAEPAATIGVFRRLVLGNRLLVRDYPFEHRLIRLDLRGWYCPLIQLTAVSTAKSHPRCDDSRSSSDKWTLRRLVTRSCTD